MKKFTTILLSIMCLVALCFQFACGSMAGHYPDGGLDFDVADGGNYQTEDIVENDFVTASVNNKSTFKLDRNTASYSLMRKQISSGLKVSDKSVRIEEYINYFDYDSFASPNGGEEIGLSYGVKDCPWNSENKLLTLGVTTEKIEVSTESNNIVLLIDVSGSMQGAERLSLVKQSLKLMVDELTDKDIVSIVTYASGTKTVLSGVNASKKTKIMKAINGLSAGGSTNGEGGIDLAYKAAEKYKNDYQNNRVILMTDGDFNVGKSSKTELEEFISEKRASGIYLSVLGFGMYNTNDITMKTLAEAGNGNYGYIDNLMEAKKLLVDELGGTMRVVAKDAKTEVTFNKETVTKFRLIGYESKLLTSEQFEDETTDSGEIGSGLRVTALYEIMPSKNEGELLANMQINYKTTSNENKSVTLAVNKSGGVVSEADMSFISAVAEYGLVLRNSAYGGTANIKNVLARLNEMTLTDEYKQDFLEVVAKASEIY